MVYYSGFVAPVSKERRGEYTEFVRKSWPWFRDRGATRMVENWGEDVQPGKQTDFLRAVKAKDDETVAFSWVEWPDKATSDKAWADMMNGGEDMGEMPFDGKRMFWGGFEKFVAEGSDRGGTYYQGFLTPVPEGNREAFEKLAGEAWNDMFKPYGALGNHESWGNDVPHGEVTDMYRAVDAKDGEVIVISWTTWPDRATCDEAARKMQESMDGKDMPDMPFDGKRMIWGGFATIFDSEVDGKAEGEQAAAAQRA